MGKQGPLLPSESSAWTLDSLSWPKDHTEPPPPYVRVSALGESGLEGMRHTLHAGREPTPRGALEMPDIQPGVGGRSSRKLPPFSVSTRARSVQYSSPWIKALSPPSPCPCLALNTA